VDKQFSKNANSMFVESRQEKSPHHPIDGKSTTAEIKSGGVVESGETRHGLGSWENRKVYFLVRNSLRSKIKLFICSGQGRVHTLVSRASLHLGMLNHEKAPRPGFLQLISVATGDNRNCTV
jgi:hypothetical protein